MNGATSDSHNRYRLWRGSGRLSLRRGVPTLVVVFTITLMAAGCRGRPASLGVASVGSTTSTAALASPAAKLAEYGGCMRSHGEPQFPNPVQNGNSVTMIKLDTGLPRTSS